MSATENTKKPGKRFNIVDALVLLLVVLLIAGVAWKLTGATRSANEAASVNEIVKNFDELPHVRFTVNCYSVPVETAEVLLRCEDTQLYNGDLELAGFVTDCTTKPTVHIYTDADGNACTVENPDTCIVTFTAEGYFDREAAEEDGNYMLGTQELRIGKGYIIKTRSFELSGSITGMEIVNG